jgi:hypothetical protein
MAVKSAHHRSGLGPARLRHLEAGLAAHGFQFLQVKTLSAARPDTGYDATRAFYLAYGFRPLEELATLWDPSNPALQLIKTVPPPVRGEPACDDTVRPDVRSRYSDNVGMRIPNHEARGTPRVRQQITRESAEDADASGGADRRIGADAEERARAGEVGRRAGILGPADRGATQW